MLIQRFKGKIHRATVTEANLNYVGSITIDGLLLDAAGIIEGESRCQPGDLVIIIAYGYMTEEEALAFEPKLAFPDADNRL